MDVEMTWTSSAGEYHNVLVCDAYLHIMPFLLCREGVCRVFFSLVTVFWECPSICHIGIALVHMIRALWLNAGLRNPCVRSL